jgi:hypothetical protein
MKVLYITQNPVPLMYRNAFRSVGIEVDLVIARTEEEVRQHLIEANTFRIVFIDYKLAGANLDTIKTGIVKAFVDAGLGTLNRPLVANTESDTTNHQLMRAGCNMVTRPIEIDIFMQSFVRSLETNKK